MSSAFSSSSSSFFSSSSFSLSKEVLLRLSILSFRNLFIPLYVGGSCGALPYSLISFPFLPFLSFLPFYPLLLILFPLDLLPLIDQRFFFLLFRLCPRLLLLFIYLSLLPVFSFRKRQSAPLIYTTSIYVHTYPHTYLYT